MRDDSLERPENTRERRIVPVVDFSLSEIKQQFEDSIIEIENKFQIAEQFIKNRQEDNCKDMWRTQIVFLDSAFDYYIHQITKYGMNKMYKKEWKKTDQYKSFLVRLELVEEILDKPEDRGWFLELVNKTYETIPLMSGKDVDKQLKLIGIDRKKVADEAFHQIGCNIKTIDQYHKAINDLYYRRNAIAHQSDRSHRDNSKNDIERLIVEDYIMKIKKIVGAIHTIATEKNNEE